MKLYETAIGRLRIVGFLEGISLLVLLCIAMPLKHIFNKPATVEIVGMIHGILFLGYVSLLLMVSIIYRMQVKDSILAFVSCITPFGFLWADSNIFKKIYQTQIQSKNK